MEELARLPENELWAVRNVGAKGFAEITEKLRTYLELNSVLARQGASPGEFQSLPSCPPVTLVDPDELAVVHEKGIPLNEISIERLALSRLEQRLLLNANIITIGELARQPREDWEREDNIKKQLKLYLSRIKEQGETKWADETSGWGASSLVPLDDEGRSLRDLVREWLSSLDEREQQIVDWRFGLFGDRLILREVGEHLGMTRERARQIEKAAIRKLHDSSRQRCVLPLVEFLGQVVVQAGGLVAEEHLRESFAEAMDVSDINPIGLVQLLLAAEPGFVEVKGIRAWALSDLPIKLIPEINRHLVDILVAEYAPLCESDLLNRFKATSWYQARVGELKDEFILACLHVSDVIVRCDEGTFGLAKWERRYQDDIILALRRLGKPAHYSEIAEAVNEELPSDQHITPRGVHIRLMQNSELFTWVGLRGTYGLTEWGVERGLTYVEAIAQILQEAGCPLTYQQILAQVPEFRPYYEESSLVLTLGTNERFRSFPGDTYGLVEWREENFAEDYRLQRLFDEVDAVPSAKPKTSVIEALESVDGFIMHTRDKANDGC